MKFSGKNKKAMTLVEIICVLVIISIVSSIALPSINNFRSSERCKSEASILVSYIRQAKYQAMQDNRLNRLIFSPENDSNSGNFFKIQKVESANLAANNPGYEDAVIYNPDDIIKGTGDPISLAYESEDWISIADTEEIEINSSVEVDISSLNLEETAESVKTIYFKPDGYLYDADNNLISEQRIVFKYGSAAIAVNINALGVIDSEVIANNDDEDYFEDGYDNSTDTDSNYSDTYGD